MNRRDFLTLRAEKNPPVLELSCERLYMRYIDAGTGQDRTALLDRISRQLDRVNEVRVTDSVWLTDDTLRLEIERVLNPFRARGGCVRIDCN
jgi:hypothetical protein